MIFAVLVGAGNCGRLGGGDTGATCCTVRVQNIVLDSHICCRYLCVEELRWLMSASAFAR